MNQKMRTIEVDSATAALLESRAEELGKSVADIVADLVKDDELPSGLAEMKRNGQGPWSPGALAEDARRYEEFERTGVGVPWEEVEAWVKSWGSPNELPRPKSRKL